MNGWESILPPLVAISLAIMSRTVILPLATGVLTGVVILSLQDGNGIGRTPWLFGRSIYLSVTDESHRSVLMFSLLLGAMVGVLESGGGIAHFIGMFARRIRSRIGGQLLIATSGLAIFFDDYANTLLIGGTMRSSADRYGISREKLAYLVDSTAAPIAGLSIISTWAATEIDYISSGLAAAGTADSAAGLQMFLQSIPYRFYPLLAIAMVFLVAWRNRDFGPMHAAESQAASPAANSAVNSAASEPASSRPHDQVEPFDRSSHPRLWLAGVVPVVLCVGVVVATLIWTGSAEAAEASADGIFLRSVELIGNGDSYLGLINGGAAGLLAALAMHKWLGDSSSSKLLWGGLRGAWQMMPAMVILWLAWALSWTTQTDQLDTGGHLAKVLSDRLAPWLLPTLVFVMAGGIAFATGTSWGTMAILTPLSIELAMRLDPNGGPSGAIALATCGSVLAGAIFGDHCSPISDTTVLSSQSSGCDHLSHVKTQLPYAMVVGLVCMVTGTLPAAFGVSPWICLALGSVTLWIILERFGKTPLTHTDDLTRYD